MKKDCALVIVAPESMTDARLIATNLAESSYPAWTADGTYGLGEIVYLPTTHRTYKSAVAGNTGKNPPTSPNEWVDNGPTNLWAMFDQSVGSQTKSPDGLIELQLRMGTVTPYLGFLNLIGANRIRVRMVDPVYGEIYDKETDLRRRPAYSSWWQWFFGDRSTPGQALFDDLPGYKNADIFITIEGTADLAIGTLLMGLPRRFSYGVQYGARVGIQDYSRKERTAYGDSVVVPRAFAKRANFTMVIDAGEVDPLAAYLAKIRTTACLWVGSDKYEATTIYGFYKNWDIVIAYPEYSVFELDLEGLT